MSNTTLGRKLQVLVLITILSVFLATEVSAISKLIKADEGGTVSIAKGVSLRIPPGALEEDTKIQARFLLHKNRICYIFGPDGTVFSKPVELVVSWEILGNAGVEDLGLYGEDRKRIEPKILKKEGSLAYRIKHFSIYYHRRR